VAPLALAHSGADGADIPGGANSLHVRHVSLPLKKEERRKRK